MLIYRLLVLQSKMRAILLFPPSRPYLVTTFPTGSPFFERTLVCLLYVCLCLFVVFVCVCGVFVHVFVCCMFVHMFVHVFVCGVCVSLFIPHSFHPSIHRFHHPINHFPFYLATTSASYHLYAVSNHSGSTFGGHYTAHCYHHKLKTWYSFSDSHVHNVSVDSVCGSQAYVLFYERERERESRL